MSNGERGRRTGQHEQKTQQAVMFTSCVQGAEQFAPPPTRVIVQTNMKPWDIEAYVRDMFDHPERILIDYEVECDGCALLVSSARTRYIGDGQRVLCPDCEEKFSDQILETRLRSITEEDE